MSKERQEITRTLMAHFASSKNVFEAMVEDNEDNKIDNLVDKYYLETRTWASAVLAVGPNPNMEFSRAQLTWRWSPNRVTFATMNLAYKGMDEGLEKVEAKRFMDGIQ